MIIFHNIADLLYFHQICPPPLRHAQHPRLDRWWFLHVLWCQSPWPLLNDQPSSPAAEREFTEQSDQSHLLQLQVPEAGLPRSQLQPVSVLHLLPQQAGQHLLHTGARSHAGGERSDRVRRSPWWDIKYRPTFSFLQQWKRLLCGCLSMSSNEQCLLSHSGYVQSNWTCHYSVLFRILVQVVMFMFFVSCEAGAQTVVYCAVSDEVLEHNGGYFTDCQPAHLRAFARDSGVAKKLWEASERLVKLAW